MKAVSGEQSGSTNTFNKQRIDFVDRQIELMTAALTELTEQMARQNDINQKILEALIDLTLQEADAPPMRDMEGNAL